MKVNLFLIGAMRSGSTSLYYYLSQHPEICMSSIKEPEYFSRTLLKDALITNNSLAENERKNILKNLYNKKDRSLPEYENLFEDGENTKILVILRNPVDRLLSDYYYNFRAESKIDLTFDDYIKHLLSEEQHFATNQLLPSSHLAFGNYYKQLVPWYEYCNPKNIKVILYEDLSNLDQQISHLFKWLAVDPTFKIKKTKTQQSGSYKLNQFRHLLEEDNFIKQILKSLIPKHTRTKLREIAYKLLLKKKQAINNESKEMLIKFYKQDIIDLENLLQRNLGNWYKL